MLIYLDRTESRLQFAPSRRNIVIENTFYNDVYTALVRIQITGTKTPITYDIGTG